MEGSLGHLGIEGVHAVRVGRRVELTVDAADEAAARAVVDRLAGELLSNPLIEAYAVEPLGAASSISRAGGALMPVRIGVVVFPGSNCDRDTVHALDLAGAEPVGLWHEQASLDGVAAVVLPGGFAYGDYLRAGVIARFSPVMRAVAAFAAEGGLVLGICNGFQVLAEAGLVPGALLRNRRLRFLGRDVRSPRSGSTRRSPTRSRRGGPLRMPVAARRGLLLRRRRDARRARARRPGPVPVRGRRRVEPAGRGDPANPNGSLRAIAGVVNAAGNVAGLMPHPERASRRSSAPTTGWGSSARSSRARHGRTPAAADRCGGVAMTVAERPVEPLHRRLGVTDDELEAIRDRLGWPRSQRPRARDVQRHVERALLVQELEAAPRDAADGRRGRRRGAGENAGVISIGDGLAVAFKIESHNHPSAVEPYQGAATGVGGILRDIFTMGARPIAVLDALRFGDPADARTRHLVDGVVRGVGGYGNCVGVPTVGGELVFDPTYRATRWST